MTVLQQGTPDFTNGWEKQCPNTYSGESMSLNSFTVRTKSHMEMIDITAFIEDLLRNASITDGFCYIFNPHTTAALTINEGADPDVQKDIINGLREIVPLKYNFLHREGNSPSHIMASLFGSSLTVAIDNGKLLLGTWQRIFFCEFDGPRSRTVHCRFSLLP
jgi:secondary thiamine-phosphate synthase enzyme